MRYGAPGVAVSFAEPNLISPSEEHRMSHLVKVIRTIGRRWTASEIEVWQANNLIVLPQDFCEFIQSRNGAVFEPNQFAIGKNNSDELRCIISLENLKGICEESGWPFPGRMLPIGETPSGNYVFLGVSKNRRGVYFWDHDTAGQEFGCAMKAAELVDQTVARIADSFEDFYSMLIPADIDDRPSASNDSSTIWKSNDFDTVFKDYLSESPTEKPEF